MGIFTSLMVFMSIVASGAAFLKPKSYSPALTYWGGKLPQTPIPKTLRELIVPLKSESIEEAKWVAAKSILGGFVSCVVHSNPYVDSAGMLVDPSLSDFFLEKDLHYGTKSSLDRSNGQHPYFLPRHLSDEIPFSSDKISMALEDLNITQGSQMALTMKQVVQLCELPAPESKYCATSLESMIDYSTSRLGTNHVRVLVQHMPRNVMKQKYTFTAIQVQSKSGSKCVVCHSQTYAYAVYYCHEPKNTKTAKVSLKGEDGTRMERVAMCHQDTSAWNPNYVGLKSLNVKPGGPSVCHFLSEGNVVWLPAN